MPIPLSTSAVNECACPKCGEQPGDPCREPSGRRALATHEERTTLYASRHNREELKALHTFRKSNLGKLFEGR